MARRVLADIDAEVLLRLANRSDISATQRAFHIDDAYRWVAMTFEHPQLEEKTTGSAAIGADIVVPLTSNIWWPEIVKDTTNNRNLTPGDKYVVENNLKLDGNPSKFYAWEGVIYIDRKPLAVTAFDIWYIKQLTELTAGQSSILDQAFDQVIIMKAASIGLSTVRDFKESHFIDVSIDNYVSEFRLPKRKIRLNVENAGIRVRMR